MKAIKLASIFAVTAVAAAVSTTTLAAEAVIKGEAGVEYVMSGNTAKTGDKDNAVNSADGFNLSELELHVDTGVVYAELEVAASPADGKHSSEAVTIGLEKIYVKQGNVSFGRFDGTLASGAWVVVDETSGPQKLDTENFGVRYKVMPGLQVSLEATSSLGATPTVAAEDSEFGFAASYTANVGMGDLSVSGGSAGDRTAYGLGFSVNTGAATVAAAYSAGSLSKNDVRGYKETDTTSYAVSVVFAASDALTITAEYGAKETDVDGAAKKVEETGTWVKAAYKVGDITYFFKNQAGDFAEANTIGAVAAF